MKKIVVMLMIIGLLFVAFDVFAGGSKEKATTEETQKEETAATTEEEPVQITYIPQNTGNPYFERINLGFQEASKDLNCEVEFIGPASPDPTSQIPIIQEQVQRGIDVLSIQANSVDALNTVFDDVMEKDIWVLANNAELTGNEEHRHACVLAVDFSVFGGYLLDLMGKLMDYEGKFAILSATPDAPAQRQWIEEPGGIKDLLENDPKYEDMELVEIAYGNDVPQKSVTECEALLSKYPDLDGLLAPTTVAITAAAQVFESTGVYPGGPTGRDIQLTGTGMPNQMRRFVKDGVVEEFMLWDPADIGYASAYLGVGLENGTIELGEGNTFDAGKLGELKFREHNLVICGPPQVFDEENVDEYDF
jgi:rhamnose transport system substrate-binding protein